MIIKYKGQLYKRVDASECYSAIKKAVNAAMDAEHLLNVARRKTGGGSRIDEALGDVESAIKDLLSAEKIALKEKL